MIALVLFVSFRDHYVSMPDARCLENSFYTLCFVFVFYLVFHFSFSVLSGKKIFSVSDGTCCAEKEVLHFLKNN